MKFLLSLVALLTLAPALLAQEPDVLAREREEQTGTAITILFDNSGSMRTNDKIGQAKSAFRSWLQTIPADYKMSLITFEDNGKLAVPLGERTRDTIAKRVAQLDANTSTPICGALKIAREQIEKRRRDVTPYERHVVLVFTDGQETADRRGNGGVRADILALRQQMVEVVGVGFHGEGDYMKPVATRFALANNEQELKQGLAKVDAEIGSVDDVVITEADLAALKSYKPPTTGSYAAIATPKPTLDSPEATPEPAPKKKGGLSMSTIITFVVIWLIVRTLFKSKKARR